jgi:hypothetical protein
LDSKEIQTWTRLALDLGVEPPDMEKGQSTQKVQQYSVRLKVRHSSISGLLSLLYPELSLNFFCLLVWRDFSW